MRALPVGCARIQRTETRPYPMAITPAAIASHRALSRVISLAPESYVVEKYKFIFRKTTRLYHKRPVQPFANAAAQDLRVGRQSAHVGRVVLAANQRAQVARA